jgi:hypothetical protein
MDEGGELLAPPPSRDSTDATCVSQFREQSTTRIGSRQHLKRLSLRWTGGDLPGPENVGWTGTLYTGKSGQQDFVQVHSSPHLAVIRV